MFKHLTIMGLSLLTFSSVAMAQPYTTQFSGGEITIDSIKRTSDETVLVKGTIKNTSQRSISFDTARLTDPAGRFLVKLQDLKTKKQFDRATVENVAVASNHYASTLADGATAMVWARVTAPPKDVTSVTISFGGDAIPIDGVPITE